MINKGMMTSNTEEWATPIKFFEELNEEFKFTLDPCATNENAKCKKGYFVIHRMEEKYHIGLRNAMMKISLTILLLLCLFLQELIQAIFTIIYIISRKLGLLEED